MAGITPDQVCAVYDAQTANYDGRRDTSLFEGAWLERFAATLPAGAAVLDLGCGTGRPLAEWLMAQGYAVNGVDVSRRMLALAQARWPGGDWRHGDMRSFDLGQTFDGVLAWNSLFHLPEADQPMVIARLSAHLRPGGTLLMTAGPEAGETTGWVGSAEVYHASLSPAQYATCLEANGLRLTAFIAEDPECRAHTVLLARKDQGDTP